MKMYYHWVNTAKAIGIVLVVLGHAISDTMLSGTGGTPRLIFDLIYSFHMPLFFFLAGFCGSKVLELEHIAEKKEYLSARMKRLMVPYFFVGALYVPLRVVLGREAERRINLKSLPADFITGLNPDFQLWTLYALFLSAVLLSVFTWRGRCDKCLLLLISGGMCILSAVVRFPYHIVNCVLSEFFFYVSGSLYRKEGDRAQRPWGVVILAAVVLSAAYAAMERSGLSAIRMVTGSSGIIVVCELSKRLEKRKMFILNLIGTYSMDIYIMANLIQVLVRSVFLNQMHLPGLICCLLSVGFGISIPIAVSKWIVRKIRITRMLVLGDFVRI